jgi:hypothetical protein
MASIFLDVLLMLLLRGVIPIVLLVVPLLRGASIIGHRWWWLPTMAGVQRGWMVPITVTREAGTVFAQALLVVSRVLILSPSQVLLLLLGVMPSHLGVPN